MVLNRNIASFDEAGFTQTLAKRGHTIHTGTGHASIEETDKGHRLLRPRNERRECRTADQRKEFPPLH